MVCSLRLSRWGCDILNELIEVAVFFMILNKDHFVKRNRWLWQRGSMPPFVLGRDSMEDQEMGKLQGGRKQTSRMPYLEEVLCER